MTKWGHHMLQNDSNPKEKTWEGSHSNSTAPTLSISQVVNSSVCGRAEQNAEVCIEVYLIAILLLIFQLPFLLLLRSAIYCGIRCSALLINSCRSPGMLALRGASSFSGFQGPCLHVEEHRRAGGGGLQKDRWTLRCDPQRLARPSVPSWLSV